MFGIIRVGAGDTPALPAVTRPCIRDNKRARPYQRLKRKSRLCSYECVFLQAGSFDDKSKEPFAFKLAEFGPQHKLMVDLVNECYSGTGISILEAFLRICLAQIFIFVNIAGNFTGQVKFPGSFKALLTFRCLPFLAEIPAST